jgi:hypothetical protein
MMPWTQWRLFAGLLLLWIGLLAQRILWAPDPVHVPLTYRADQRATRSADDGVPSTPPQARTAQTVTLHEPKNIFAGPETAPKKESVIPVGRRHRLQSAPPAPISVDQQEAVAQGPPPPSPEEFAEQEARRQQQLTDEARRRQEALIIDEARQRLGQYRFLGYVTQGGEQRAFLAKGKELYIASVGELLDGKIHVTRMDGVSVRLTDAITKLEQTVALSKDGAGS